MKSTQVDAFNEGCRQGQQGLPNLGGKLELAIADGELEFVLARFLEVLRHALQRLAQVS